jgi:transcriptional regulator with XRE-family HTH domain
MALGLSQADLAKQADISVRTLRRIEKGEHGTSPGAKRVLLLLASSEGTSAPTEQELEDSENRILDANYPFIKIINATIFLTIAFAGAGYLANALADRAHQPDADWWNVIVSGTIALLAITVFAIIDIRAGRTARAIYPDCERLLDSMETGQLRYINAEALHVLRKLLGSGAVNHAMSSRRCRVIVIGDESILSGDDSEEVYS